MRGERVWKFQWNRTFNTSWIWRRWQIKESVGLAEWLAEWFALIVSNQWHHLSYVKIIFIFLIIRNGDGVNQTSRKDWFCVKEPWYQFTLWLTVRLCKSHPPQAQSRSGSHPKPGIVVHKRGMYDGDKSRLRNKSRHTVNKLQVVRVGIYI